jgi:hypothetical protein
VQSSGLRTPVLLPNVPGLQGSGVSTPTTQYDPCGHNDGVTVALPQVNPEGHSAQSESDRAPRCAR